MRRAIDLVTPGTPAWDEVASLRPSLVLGARHATRSEHDRSNEQMSMSLVRCDLFFDLAERGAGQHALRHELVNERVRTARDNDPPKAPPPRLFNSSTEAVLMSTSFGALASGVVLAIRLVSGASRVTSSVAMGCPEEVEGRGEAGTWPGPAV